MMAKRKTTVKPKDGCTITPLCRAAPDLLAKCIKVRDYFLRLAKRSEHNAGANDFSAYREACEFDAKNWRATAKDITSVIDKVRLD